MKTIFTSILLLVCLISKSQTVIPSFTVTNGVGYSAYNASANTFSVSWSGGNHPNLLTVVSQTLGGSNRVVNVTFDVYAPSISSYFDIYVKIGSMNQIVNVIGGTLTWTTSAQQFTFSCVPTDTLIFFIKNASGSGTLTINNVIITDNLTGIYELSKKELLNNFFAEGSLYFQGNLKNEKVNVFNSTGQLVLETSIREKIDVQNLNLGIYFVQILDKNNIPIQNKKILINN